MISFFGIKWKNDQAYYHLGGMRGGGLSKVISDTRLTLKNIFEVTKTFGNDILIKKNVINHSQNSIGITFI